MGDPLARNPHPGAAAPGAMPPRFPHRQLFARWHRIDRHPRLGIRWLGRSGRGYRLVLLQGLALCPARPRGRRHRRAYAVLPGLRNRLGAPARSGAAVLLGNLRQCALGGDRAAAERPLSDRRRARSLDRDHRPPRRRMRVGAPDDARPGRHPCRWTAGVLGRKRPVWPRSGRHARPAERSRSARTRARSADRRAAAARSGVAATRAAPRRHRDRDRSARGAGRRWAGK